MNKNTFCPLPFSHLAIRPNGNVYPCCIFRWDNVPDDFKITDPNIFNHPFLEDIRNKMRNNEYVDGCSRCYENEDKTGKSTRIHFLEKGTNFGLDTIDVNDPKLVYLDLALSNTCNNRCRMCGPELSTNWYSDAKALGMKIPKGIIEQNIVLENYDLSTLRAIKLIGGEPLMEQEKFINVLKRCDRKNLAILLTTNGTLTPNEELYSLLLECKKVSINLSIDAFGSLNDFLRKGSKWEKTVENMIWFDKHFAQKMNIKSVAVHSVASIYNLNQIDKLYIFIKNTFPNMDVDCVLADGPNWMMPRHLPEDVKIIIKNKLEELNNIGITSLSKIAIDELNKSGDFRLFMKHDEKLNNLRNEHWKTVNPELYEMVKRFYE
jgi:sulfatase maturation enzyme AslB (radical SAM superfamily)